MYHGGNQLLVRNPIERYLINSPMLPGMKRNADGGVTLHIQKDDPGGDLQPNWLPAPDGPIYLVMRLYWPKTTQPALLPIGPGQWKPPGIVRIGWMFREGQLADEPGERQQQPAEHQQRAADRR